MYYGSIVLDLVQYRYKVLARFWPLRAAARSTHERGGAGQMTVAETRAVHRMDSKEMQSCTIVAIYRYLHGTYRVACYRDLLDVNRCEQLRNNPIRYVLYM